MHFFLGVNSIFFAQKYGIRPKLFKEIKENHLFYRWLFYYLKNDGFISERRTKQEKILHTGAR